MVTTDLDPRLTFDTFVVGPANRLASAAARRAADSPGTSYNPLFIYSASGLGKSHILASIAHHSLRVNPEQRVVYKTIEGYLDELTQALEGGDRESLRSRYRELDILLLDDVQFLTGQPEAQEMLLRTLDSLGGSGSQIVLASDRPPSEIDGLDERLISRFSGGLIIDIAAPEYETRAAIVRRKVEERGAELAPGVAEAVARVPFGNVRELGGALNRILAVQELEVRTVTAAEVSGIIGIGDGDAAGDEAAPSPETEEEWQTTLRTAAEEAEAEGFQASRLRKVLQGGSAPEDPEGVVEGFREGLEKLRAIRGELEDLGNPWPQTAEQVARDPERLEEAEAFLVSVRERLRPFPALPAGPSLDEIEKRLPPLAVKAAIQLVRTGRPEYNPLYVWSEEGTGARALLGAAARTFADENPGKVVALTSLAAFAEEFIDALRRGVAGAWRERWWSVDLLVVHGLEELTDTERAQDEFFHLFEALKRRSSRSILAANCAPAGIGGIDERLRSRFEGGLVLEVESDEVEPEAADLTVDPDADEGDVFIPPLDQIQREDRGRGGLIHDPAEASWFVGGSRAEGFQGTPAAPAAAAEGEEASAAGAAEPPPAEDPAAAEEQPAPAEEPAAAQESAGDEGSQGGSWRPSPEKVIWEWPYIEERLVEEME